MPATATSSASSGRKADSPSESLALTAPSAPYFAMFCRALCSGPSRTSAAMARETSPFFASQMDR